MAKTIRIGIDTSKSVFQLHAVDETEKPVLRKQLRRSQMLEFFGKLEPTKIGLEACGASHYWARELTGLGHQVLLVPPQYAKKYVKRNKNDAADAEAICEAMSSADDALCAGEDGRAASGLDAGGHAGGTDSSPHAAEQ